MAGKSLYGRIWNKNGPTPARSHDRTEQEKEVYRVQVSSNASFTTHCSNDCSFVCKLLVFMGRKGFVLKRISDNTARTFPNPVFPVFL